MEIEQGKEQEVRETGKFVINDLEFRSVYTSGDRIIAVGKKRTCFEIIVINGGG